MTYNTFPRTRQAVYGMTLLWGGGLLVATAWRWKQTHQARDIVVALWVLGIAWATVKVLRGLEGLEQQRSEPDEAMELLLYAAWTLAFTGYLPLIFYLTTR